MNKKERKRIQAALDSVSERKFKEMGDQYQAFMGAIGALEFALGGGEGDLGFKIFNAEYVLVEKDDIDEMLH